MGRKGELEVSGHKDGSGVSVGIGDGNTWVRSVRWGGERIEKNGVVRYMVKKEKEGVSGKWKTISKREIIS